MEVLIVLLVLGALLALWLAPLLIALQRTAKQDRRLVALEREVLQLQELLSRSSLPPSSSRIASEAPKVESEPAPSPPPQAAAAPPHAPERDRETAPEPPPAAPEEAPRIAEAPRSPAPQRWTAQEEAAPVAASAPAPPAPPARPRLDIDWEQWLGIRGAAVLGGVLLALAALFFLRVAVEQGWFPPVVRVALGFLVGSGAVAASDVLRRRGYDTTANALAGAGLSILYAAIWATAVLYELLGLTLAFGLMALVTLTCGLLSWRHRSRVIALLGLLGGFSTPLLLSSGRDDPVGLFGYLLLLNLGLVFLARQRGWPELVPVALAGTAVFEALWIFGRMGPDRVLLGLSILAVFALFFAVASRPGSGVPGAQRSVWQQTRITGTLLPFAFAFYFGSRGGLEVSLLPLSGLLLLLSVAACWIDRSERTQGTSVAAAAATLGVLLSWVQHATLAERWNLIYTAVVLAAVFHLFAELRVLRPVREEPTGDTAAPTPFRWTSELVAAAGGVGLLGFLLLAQEPPPVALWLLGLGLLAAFLVRQAFFAGQGPRLLFAAAALGLGPGIFHSLHRETSFAVFAATAFAAAVIFQVMAVALHRRPGESPLPRLADAASAAIPLGTLLSLYTPQFGEVAPLADLAGTLGLAFLVVLAATRLPSGKLYFTEMALLALLHLMWIDAQRSLREDPTTLLGAFGLQLVAVVLFTFWPFAAPSLRRERWGWYAAALAAPAWFLGLRYLYVERFGKAYIGILPVALGALGLAAVALARRQLPEDSPARRRALVWLSAAALCFVSVAIPLQLSKEWITVGWGIQALAVTALWRRLDHPGLKVLVLALAAAVLLRLVANPALLLYHPASGTPVLNWLLYTYLIPAAAFFGAASILAPLETQRLRPKEASLVGGPRPWLTAVLAVGGIVLVFVWINLTIFDAFSTGPRIDLSLSRLPARDLTLSLAWALYALALLTAGFFKRLAPLRWAGLAFLCLTLAKLFLYDLGELSGLYRVASLVGLALSLLGVSLAYQRFLRGVGEEDEGAGESSDEELPP